MRVSPSQVVKKTFSVKSDIIARDVENHALSKLDVFDFYDSDTKACWNKVYFNLGTILASPNHYRWFKICLGTKKVSR